MKESIERAYPATTTNNCLSIQTAPKFEIFDCPVRQRCFVRMTDEEPYHFTVENPYQKGIHFLAIDNCLFTTANRFERCDCAVFDESTFCFIEIKDSNPRQRSDNRKKAKAQLKSTIRHFRNHLNFTGYTLEAYLCMGTKKVYPAVRTSDLSAQIEFENELSTTLLEGNLKKFE